MLTPTEIKYGVIPSEEEIWEAQSSPWTQSILETIARAVRHPVEGIDEDQELTDGDIIDYLDSYLQQLGV